MSDNKSSGGLRYSHAHPSKAYKEYRAYSKDWKKTYFDSSTGGFVVTHKERIKSGSVSKHEREKFEKEQGMAIDLAKGGHRIEHLPDSNRPKGRTYDIHYDGRRADLKNVSSHNNIEKYVRHAVKDQGAKVVIIRLEKGVKIDKALIAIRNAKRKYHCSIVYYSQSGGKIHEK